MGLQYSCRCVQCFDIGELHLEQHVCSIWLLLVIGLHDVFTCLQCVDALVRCIECMSGWWGRFDQVGKGGGGIGVKDEGAVCKNV